MAAGVLKSFVLSFTFVVACAAQPSFLLPDDVIPTKHVIELTIDPDKDTFSGRARIDVELKKSTSTIWLNAKDITPGEASVGSRSARAEAAGDEFIGLRLDAPAGPGRTTISIAYRGKLDEKAIVGPYRKKSGDDWYVFTSFTPIDARRAFPCFDEPRFKTPWEMTIHVKRSDKAFANGQIVSETEEPDGMKAVRFATTKPLPAEVVAFAVGPFDIYDGEKAGQGTPIRVITAKGHAAEGKTAAQSTVEVLPRLEAYTGIPYPFGKLDHLAVPEFPFGATENPGLIVYRNRALLASPGDDTPEKAHAIRGLQAHEIGHQWFGDLVTQATWNDVWLSEGFATWFSAKVMDEEQAGAREHLASVAARERIMATDASPRTRPVRLPMTSREDTKGVYSQMVYQKGAAILLMLDNWLGEDKFQNALRAYLKRHAFGTATTEDLETAIRTSTGTDPTAVMDSFLNQTGIPVIRGAVKCGGETPSLEIEQINPAHQWTIPVCWRSDGSAPAQCTVLKTSKTTISLPRGSHCPAWLYVNARATGYYRTEWTAEQLNALPLNQLTPAERLMLVYDLRALKDRLNVSDLLGKLGGDAEPEISKAASEAMLSK
ncbi:MAG TPA: M1 family aminopeptidase [Bryobacteraceae bacterium]|nr:M1 family aminopeptidase [Bryobacteraceae bacterium]